MGARRIAFTAVQDPDWQPGEVDYEPFRGDLKVSKMTIKRLRPKVDVEVHVLAQPARYESGSGPPSGPIDLHLECDTHLDANQRAFIVDKVILPREPFIDVNDPRQRRAHYIIGWPDLPGARPVIDCANAAEYVSPHAIEEWEYKDFLRREDEKEKADEAAAIALVAAAIAAEQGQSVQGAAGVVPPHVYPNGKKKPGRKPKNARLQDARAPTPQLDSEQEESLARRKQGPSLSTPQKSRLSQLEAERWMDLQDESMDDMEGDGEGDDADEQVRRQLEGGTRSEVADSMDEDDDYADLPNANTGASAFQRLSHAGSTRPPVEHKNFGSFVGRSSGSAGSPSLPSAVQQQRPSLASHFSQTQRARPTSKTPIPLPPRPAWASTGKLSSSSPAQTIVPSIETRAPGEGHAQATKLATRPLDAQAGMAGAPSSAVPSSSNGYTGFTPANNFTPVQGFPSRPPKRSAEGSQESTPSTTKGKAERSRKTPKLSQPPPEPQPPQEYVVKRLEDDAVIDGVQYFQVRWEGDWPADQNPTWEPRANISRRLIRTYHERKRRQEAKSTPVKGATGNGGPRGSLGKTSTEKKQSTLTSWASQFNYGSVSEAFEGQAELDRTVAASTQHEDQGADGDEDELAGDVDELFIVDNKRAADEREKDAAQLRRTLSAQVAADLANTKFV